MRVFQVFVVGLVVVISSKSMAREFINCIGHSSRDGRKVQVIVTRTHTSHMTLQNFAHRNFLDQLANGETAEEATRAQTLDKIVIFTHGARDVVGQAIGDVDFPTEIQDTIFGRVYGAESILLVNRTMPDEAGRFAGRLIYPRTGIVELKCRKKLSYLPLNP